MATYYISKSGNDSNNGLGPDASHASNKPWLTIGKALGASGIASGDTVYIAPGVYRETVTVAMTSATVETRVIGDVANAQGFKDGSGNLLASGMIRWTAYTTNDKTAPAASAALTLSARDFLTFENLVFQGGNASPSAVNASATSTDIVCRRCVFLPGSGGGTVHQVSLTIGADLAANWTFDSCRFIRAGGNALNMTLTRPSAADQDVNIQIVNCVVLGGANASAAINILTTGANTFNPGGVDVDHCTIVGGNVTTGANISTSIPCTVYNSVLLGYGTGGVNANTSGQIIEDYNWILANTPRTNVTAGGNSISDGSYALLVDAGISAMIGASGRELLAPLLDSPFLGFGNQAGGAASDIVGVPRPSGPAPTWANVLNSIGAYERGNTAIQETSTVRTGSNAIKILGPGVHDFDVAVDAVSTTLSVYVRWNSSYTGTKPQFKVLNGTECGVSDATDTATGSADTWELLELTFTPVRAGIVTVRIQSNSTAAAGAVFADDFAIA